MKRSWISIISIMLIIALCACNSGPKVIGHDAAPAQESQQQSSLDIFVQGQDVVQLPLDTAVILKAIMPEIGDSNQYNNKVLQKAEEATGVRIDVLGTMDARNPESMELLASVEAVDIIWGEVRGGSPYQTNYSEALVLNDYLAKYAPNYVNLVTTMGAQADVLNENGDADAFYILYENPGINASSGPVIRQDWLDALGMDAPETYDDYYNVLKAFKTEYNPDLCIHIWPELASSAGWLSSGYSVAVDPSNPGNSFYQVDGVVKFAPLEDGFLQYVTMLAQWYSEGFFTTQILDSFEIGSNSYLIQKSIGSDGMFYVNYEGIEIVESITEISGLKLSPIQDAVIQTGDRTHFAEKKVTNAGSMGFSVESMTENPEAAVVWIDFWYGDEGRALLDGEPKGSEYDPGNNLQRMIAVYSSDSLQEQYSSGYAAVNAVWTRNKDTDFMLPKGLYFEDEDEETLNVLLRDLSTGTMEGLVQFVMNDRPLEEFEDFRGMLYDMGVERCISIYQKSLNNYYR